MKLTEYSGSPTTTNMTSVDMGISDDPTDQLLILNVLSNTLYTDKVSAVWREYGCNAYDANVEAGRGEMPIEITLPSKLAPEAKIRDFGFGMTDQQVLQVFCKLGRSTKRGSNELVGMLGIGSKAGFAYGDNFTVTSWAQGKKTIYTCFRDQGVPRLSKMHEESSNAPEGVEVKVPVKLQDIPDFITKAERVFRYFRVRPIVHGGTLQYQARGKAVFSGPHWRFIGEGTDSVAVMGNIGYKIDESALPSTYGSKRRTLLELGVELDFNIGDLEISANREGLQMKDQTLKAIGDRLDEMLDEIAKVFTNKVANAQSLWEAKSLYRQAFETQGAHYYRGSLRDIIGSKIFWRGKPVQNGNISVENAEKDPEVSVVGYTRRWGRSKCSRTDDPDHVTCDDTDTLLVINDTPTKPIAVGKIRYWFDQHSTVRTIIVFTFHTAAAKPRYFGRRELTGAPTTLMSTMPKPPPKVPTGGQSAVVSAHRAKHSASAFTLRPLKVGEYFVTESQYWDTVRADLDADGVWVKISKFAAIPSPAHRVTSSATLREQVDMLTKAGLLKGPLYGFKSDRWDKVTAAPTWKLLNDHLAGEFKKLLAEPNARQELADYLAAAKYMYYQNPLVLVQHQKEFPAGSLMRDFLDEIHRMLSPAKNAKAWYVLHTNRCSEWFPTPTMLPKPTTNLADFEKRVRARYPMLDHWDPYKLRSKSVTDLKPVIDYVQLVEDNT